MPTVAFSDAAVTRLQTLVEGEKDRIVRLWGKLLVAEAPQETRGHSIREPLTGLVYQLARLLHERPDDAVRLWPASVRAHGVRRYEDRYSASDLVREWMALHAVLLRVLMRQRTSPVDAQVVELIGALIGEAIATTVSSYTRVLRTEEVRFREAALMESILHRVDVGILLAEADGTITFGTPPVERLFGAPPRSLIGSVARERLGSVLHQRNACHPDGTEFLASDLPLVRALAEKVPIRDVAVELERPDGTSATIEMTAVPLFDEALQGQLVGAVQTMVDRTQAAAQSRELARAYRDLQLAQGHLLQRIRTRALGQLASSTSHALNNALNVLRLRLTLLRKDLRLEHLDPLERQVKNISDVVSRLQAFAAAESIYEPRDVELEQAIREAIDLARSRLEASTRPVELIIGSMHAAARVRADPNLLREVIVGMILAGLERMPEGGRLELRAETTSEGAVVQVLDEGEHIEDPKALAALFDPLQGAAAQPERALLMGVARTEVQRWGGELAVEPRAGGARGLQFQLRLVAEQAPAQPVVGVEPQKPSRRVLVVDDDPDNAWMMAEALGDEGYDVQVAHSGQVARELWGSQRFDAALLDVLMPDVSGWELARQFRQVSPRARLAMVTGADVRGQSRESLAQVDAVFGKPIDVGALDEFLSESR